MNYFKLAGVIAVLSVSSQLKAQDYQFVAADNNPETNLCVSAVNNDLDAMKGRLFRMGMGDAVRKNINRITCNDMSVAKFAHKYRAEDTFVYLNNRSAYGNKAKPSVSINDLAQTSSSDEPVIVYVSSAR